jgi:hypothetical protein
VTPIKEGDEVRVFESNRRGQSEDGWPGEVVKVGSKLATISYRGSESVFRLDTGHLNSKEYGSGTYFLTPGDVESRKRQTAARAVLRDAGFEVRVGHRPPSELLEALAEVAKTFTTPEAEG